MYMNPNSDTKKILAYLCTIMFFKLNFFLKYYLILFSVEITLNKYLII